MTENNSIAYSDENALVTTRIFKTPRELVFKAWTLPEHLAKWWGPYGFTSTFQEFDFKPGGRWKFIFHGPDGIDYQNESVFVEIVKPELIVFNHVSNPRFQIMATFEELDKNTIFTFRQSFESSTEFERAKTYCEEGNKQTIDRLEIHLKEMSE